MLYLFILQIFAVKHKLLDENVDPGTIVEFGADDLVGNKQPAIIWHGSVADLYIEREVPLFVSGIHISIAHLLWGTATLH